MHLPYATCCLKAKQDRYFEPIQAHAGIPSNKPLTYTHGSQESIAPFCVKIHKISNVHARIPRKNPIRFCEEKFIIVCGGILKEVPLLFILGFHERIVVEV